MAKDYSTHELDWIVTAIKVYVNDLYPKLAAVRDKAEKFESEQDFDQNMLENLNSQVHQLDKKITAFNDLFYYLQEAYDTQYRKEYNETPPPKISLFDYKP